MIETLIAAFLWLGNVGTNTWVAGFVLNNIIILGVIVALTKTKKDDALLKKLREQLGINGGNKDDEKDL